MGNIFRRSGRAVVFNACLPANEGRSGNRRKNRQFLTYRGHEAPRRGNYVSVLQPKILHHSSSVSRLHLIMHDTRSQINLAVVLDASGSISSTEWELEKNFAKDVISEFESKNLFANGGSASYVQFSSGVSSFGTFDSSAAYEDYVDADSKILGGTNIEAGIMKGRELLNASPSTAAIMIVITDGEWTNGNDPSTEADAARADGTTIFAVGVGERELHMTSGG